MLAWSRVGTSWPCLVAGARGPWRCIGAAGPVCGSLTLRCSAGMFDARSVHCGRAWGLTGAAPISGFAISSAVWFQNIAWEKARTRTHAPARLAPCGAPGQRLASPVTEGSFPRRPRPRGLRAWRTETVLTWRIAACSRRRFGIGISCSSCECGRGRQIGSEQAAAIRACRV